MKTLFRLGGVVIVLLLALTACNLNQISVRWTIDAFSPAGPIVQVNYTVWNDGAYDLAGVSLEIGVLANPPNYYISDWTPYFSLNQNETKAGSFFINIGAGAGAVITAEVLGVHMDKPKD